MFLNELDVLINENFILPKSVCVCILRYIGDDGTEHGSKKALEHMELELDVETMAESAREEREAGANYSQHVDQERVGQHIAAPYHI